MFVLPDADSNRLEDYNEVYFDLPDSLNQCWQNCLKTTIDGYTVYTQYLSSRVWANWALQRGDKTAVISINIFYNSFFTYEAEKTQEEANNENDYTENLTVTSNNVSIDEVNSEAEKSVDSDEFVIVEKSDDESEAIEHLGKKQENELQHEACEETNELYHSFINENIPSEASFAAVQGKEKPDKTNNVEAETWKVHRCIPRNLTSIAISRNLKVTATSFRS